MVRILSLVSFYLCSLFALSANEFAYKIVSDESKKAQIDLLFSAKNYLDENNRLDMNEVTKILKMNSLVNFTLEEPQSLTLSFKTQGERILFFKILTDALNKSGIVYFIPDEIKLEKNNIYYQITLQTRYLLDPGIFYNILKENLVFIDDIQRLDTYHYEYTLNFSNAILQANVNLSLENINSLSKPLKDYVFSVKGVKIMMIYPKNGDVWFPKILFLDKSLKLIQSVQSKERQNEWIGSVPSEAVYAIVSDNYSLDNIRRGLEIELQP